MSLTFENFRQVIPEQILSRGRDYVRRQNILDLMFDDEENLWEAQVEGTEIYDVRVQRLANSSLECACTCPYDYGPYCKHVAAVLYAIEETFGEEIKTKPRKRSGKRQTRHDKLRLRLENISRETLVAAILELAAQDRELLNQLLIRFDSGEPKATDYKRVVKDALRLGRGEYGYLDYTGSIRSAKKLSQLLDQADQWLAAGDITRAPAVYQAVIDELVAAIAQADDSSGSLGDCIGQAIEGLRQSAERSEGANRDALMVYCMEHARRKEFRAWDWGWELLGIATELVDNPKRRADVEKMFDEIEQELKKDRTYAASFHQNYELEQIAAFRLELIERLDGKAAGRSFLVKHTDLDRMRMLLIERCMEEGELNEAFQLIEDGIFSSQRQHLPGLTNQYRALRVKLLEKRGDNQGVIDGARTLWLKSGDPQYYALLKQTVPAVEWGSFLNKLISEMPQRIESLAWVYAEEGMWRELLALIQPDYDWLLETYHQPLEKHLPDETAALYARIIDAILVKATGRGAYKRAVFYLRQMKRLGKEEQVAAIVNRLRTQYNKRAALLDELSHM